jgi:hypothetical protein
VNHKLAAVIATATLAATVLATTALVLPRETAPPLSCGRQARLDPTKLSAVPSLQWATDGSVEAVLPCGETVFVGGGFDVIGPYTGSFASVSPRTGVADVGATALHRPVDAIVSDGDGGWVVAMTSEGAAVGAGTVLPSFTCERMAPSRGGSQHALTPSSMRSREPAPSSTSVGSSRPSPTAHVATRQRSTSARGSSPAGILASGERVSGTVTSLCRAR